MSSARRNRVQIACEGFTGPLNCAQAVATAFQCVSGLTTERIANQAHSGGGRAPGGICGALHAALEVLEKDVDREALAAEFAEIAGSSLCREIRKTKQTSCAGCVETAATLLVNHLEATNNRSANVGE